VSDTGIGMDEETRRRQNAFQRWPPPRRSSGNFRLYEEAHRERLGSSASVECST